MHALHKIVVEASDAEEAVDAAKSALDNYYLSAYDYYDEDGGARWGDAYAQPVSAQLDKDRFLTELKSVRKMQRKEAFGSLADLKGISDKTSLGQALSAILDNQADFLDSWLVGLAFDLARGKYRFESGFYDVDEGSAFVTDSLLANVEQGEKNLWMLFFDLHF